MSILFHKLRRSGSSLVRVADDERPCGQANHRAAEPHKQGNRTLADFPSGA